MDTARIIEEIETLAPLSPTTAALADVVSRSDSTIDEMVTVIGYDEALTLNVLRFANSVASASARTISTVKDAVIRLGGARILGYLVASRAGGALSVSLEGYGYHEQELWRHSVAAALAAEQISRTCGKNGLSFTASLLHDIGKLVLVRFVPAASMERVWSVAQCVAASQAEEEVLGVTHAEIGGHICRHWGLPDPLVDAVRFHHSCTESLEPLTDVVRIANVAARAMGEGVGNEGMSCELDRGIGERTGLTRDGLEKICAGASDRLASVLELFASL